MSGTEVVEQGTYIPSELRTTNYELPVETDIPKAALVLAGAMVADELTFDDVAELCGFNVACRVERIQGQMLKRLADSELKDAETRGRPDAGSYRPTPGPSPVCPSDAEIEADLCVGAMSNADPHDLT